MKYFWTQLAKNILLSNNQIFLTEIKTDTSTACFAHCAMLDYMMSYKYKMEVN